MRFNLLSIEANDTGTEEAFKKLVNEVLQQPNLYLLMSTVDRSRAYAGKINGKVWLFLYTSPEQVNNSFEGVLQEKAEAYYVQLDTKESIPWLLEHSDYGIDGIRINEGPHGFWILLEDLKPIVNELNDF
ncbi:hypothetical protein M2444_004767 [Paenibacillus sp. PastF-3]|uniref:hypothetical protein n=1 Tax=unclassified Paenibacillus TaxID=185978 RepID=UPI000BA01B89|nr:MULTISPECIES: hypothetical protein [unclassified Paenibacillus]MDH6372938.1 hypothetical protein [Paenibacillus sp. PastF-3]OZQ81160.1 hypothetical protein CA598_26960 [Paenibacillus sp. VTT E-133291]